VHTRILSATAPLNLVLNYLLGEVLSYGIVGPPRLNDSLRHISQLMGRYLPFG